MFLDSSLEAASSGLAATFEAKRPQPRALTEAASNQRSVNPSSSRRVVLMSKKIAICLALVSLLALGGQAVAEIGTIDDVPAATLLLPYFEVDLNSTNGVTTLFSINNASAAAALAHVTVWTDLSVPVLDFDVYLTGYDVQTINMRDILNGILPKTADDNSDPDADNGAGISNDGDPTGTVLGDPADTS